MPRKAVKSLDQLGRESFKAGAPPETTPALTVTLAQGVCPLASGHSHSALAARQAGSQGPPGNVLALPRTSLRWTPLADIALRVTNTAGFPHLGFRS